MLKRIFHKENADTFRIVFLIDLCKKESSRKKEAFLVRGTPCLKYIHRKKIKRRRSCFRVLSTDGAMVHVISHRD